MEEITLNKFMQKVNSYRQSRIILTAYELDFFSAIEKSDGTVENICSILGTNTRASIMLTDVLSAMGILIKVENIYSNSTFAKKFLVKSSPFYLSGLAHSNNLWNLWSGLTNSVTKGKPANRENINERNDKWLKNFIEAMHIRGRKQAPETIVLLNLKNVNHVLDIGGGSGIFSMAFVDAKKGLLATVFDLPNIISLTKRYIINEGYQKSIKTKIGDYTEDSLGKGYDLVFLSAIIHINSEITNNELINKCFNALNKGGQIVISDIIMSNDRLEPIYGAEFAINMLVATDEGNTYTESEITTWLKNAGFIKFNRINLAEKGSMIIGKKP